MLIDPKNNVCRCGQDLFANASTHVLVLMYWILLILKQLTCTYVPPEKKTKQKNKPYDPNPTLCGVFEQRCVSEVPVPVIGLASLLAAKTLARYRLCFDRPIREGRKIFKQKKNISICFIFLSK